MISTLFLPIWIRSRHFNVSFAIYEIYRYNSITFIWEDPLANLKSAIKRIRSNERKSVRNRIIRSRARSAVSSAREAVTKGSGEESVRRAIRELDRAAEKGVIHKNNAARRKSRLLRKLHTAKNTKRTG